LLSDSVDDYCDTCLVSIDSINATSKGERLRFKNIYEFLYLVFLNKNIDISVQIQTDILFEERSRASYTLVFCLISELVSSDF
jgi:hypothetical protein